MAVGKQLFQAFLWLVGGLLHVMTFFWGATLPPNPPFPKEQRSEPLRPQGIHHPVGALERRVVIAVQFGIVRGVKQECGGRGGVPEGILKI